MSLFPTNSLINWFETNQRDLPWRHNKTPYKVWLSEVMLQQTQVTTVIPYYLSWLEEFPTIHDLAKAPLEKVIKLWEGLGYYSRARNLHQAAKWIVAHYKGKLPEDEEKLKQIKGMGPYTVAAILSFAFHKSATPVDGNVKRVLARYFLIEKSLTDTQLKKVITSLHQKILPKDKHWVFNEALIELGALLCRKTKPLCSDCPLQSQCQAYQENKAENIPVKLRSITYESLQRAVLVIQIEGAFLLKKPQQGKIMQDLYEFPYFNFSRAITENQVYQWIQDNLQLDLTLLAEGPLFKQSFTKYRVRLYPFLFKGIHRKCIEGYEWQTLEKLEEKAFSSGHRKIAHHFFNPLLLDEFFPKVLHT